MLWFCMLFLRRWCLFFFQAEDGIRDSSVTGVQTCALPICLAASRPAGQAPPAQIMAQSAAASGAPAEVARAHHGSVSRAERAQIEEALKAGRLPAGGATSRPGIRIDKGAGGPGIQGESAPSVGHGAPRTRRGRAHRRDA